MYSYRVLGGSGTSLVCTCAGMGMGIGRYVIEVHDWEDGGEGSSLVDEMVQKDLRNDRHHSDQSNGLEGKFQSYGRYSEVNVLYFVPWPMTSILSRPSAS